MPTHIKYTEAERKLAARARRVAGVRDVLYHGTRYAQLISATGILLPPELGSAVSLTRSAEVAAYWASMERDDDEGVGSILVLNRASLEESYDLTAIPDVFWLSADRFHNEAEEEIRADVVDLSNHLFGTVSGRAAEPSIKRTQLNQKRNILTAIRLQELHRHDDSVSPDDFALHLAAGTSDPAPTGRNAHALAPTPARGAIGWQAREDKAIQRFVTTLAKYKSGGANREEISAALDALTITHAAATFEWASGALNL